MFDRVAHFSVNDEVISIFPKMPNVRPLTGQRYEHLFAPKHYQGRKAGQAAYRPRDSVMDMSNKQEVASPSIYQYYDERSSVESPDEYYEYRYVLDMILQSVIYLF